MRPTIFVSDFLATTYSRRHGTMLSKKRKDISLNLILDPAKFLINYKGKIMAYSEKQRLRKFTTLISFLKITT